MSRSIDSLTAHDFVEFPVWRFIDSDSPREDYVKAVRRLPVKNMTGLIFGGPILLADGTTLTGYLGNFDATKPELTEHFLTVSLFGSDGTIFHLARYHDIDAIENGPSALARFLDKSLEQIFPLKYDVSLLVSGFSEVTRGSILSNPRKRLTRAEIIALAVP
jgi:hypothetical protein